MSAKRISEHYVVLFSDSQVLAESHVKLVVDLAMSTLENEAQTANIPLTASLRSHTGTYLQELRTSYTEVGDIT